MRIQRRPVVAAEPGNARLGNLAREASQRGEDVGDLGASGVVGLDVDEADDSTAVNNEHCRSRQANGTFGVDLCQIETEIALRGEDIVSLLERDADPVGQSGATGPW